VDIFVLPTGDFGFQEYRRDIVDSQWFPLGCDSERRFKTAEAALKEAISLVPWLKEIVHQ
jgi:hypothetical protein